MEKIGKQFSSFAEAEQAEDYYYKSLTPDQRVNLLLELVAQHSNLFNGTSERFERVFRVAPLQEG
jgi:hypothetical protein